MLFSVSSAYASSEQHSEKLSAHQEETYKSQPISDMISGFLKSTGIYALINPDPNEVNAHGEKISDFNNISNL